MTSFAHAMPFGAEVRSDGAVRFRLWAPGQAAVAVVIGEAARPCRWRASTAASSSW